MAQASPRRRRERRLRRTLSQTRRLLTKSLEHRQYLATQVNQLVNRLNQIASNAALDAPGATISVGEGQEPTCPK